MDGLGSRGVRCSEPSLLRVRLCISKNSDSGECDRALFLPRPPITEGLGLVSREEVSEGGSVTLPLPGVAGISEYIDFLLLLVSAKSTI